MQRQNPSKYPDNFGDNTDSRKCIFILILNAVSYLQRSYYEMYSLYASVDPPGSWLDEPSFVVQCVSQSAAVAGQFRPPPCTACYWSPPWSGARTHGSSAGGRRGGRGGGAPGAPRRLRPGWSPAPARWPRPPPLQEELHRQHQPLMSVGRAAVLPIYAPLSESKSCYPVKKCYLMCLVTYLNLWPIASIKLYSHYRITPLYTATHSVYTIRRWPRLTSAG